ncbi:MAG: hypothetical protein Q9227_008855 [Pyrenula ochraceoflavens]
MPGPLADAGSNRPIGNYNNPRFPQGGQSQDEAAGQRRPANTGGNGGGPNGLNNGSHDLDGQTSTDDRSGRLRENGPENSGQSRSRSRPSGAKRMCKKCGEPLTGQFVRALGGTFHLDCFKCRDCGDIVASKFFPVDYEDGSGQYPLCETDYFRRLDLLCHSCGGALRGSYITALDRKYHIEHFTCSVCPTIFGAQDSYYEHDGKVYCHYHYSTQFAQRCNGCQTAILKQFVEIFRGGENQHWHPECYMIHKFWNVRLAPIESGFERPELDAHATEEQRVKVRDEEDLMENKVYRIWSILSTFEEASAQCISDMLLHVSNGEFAQGVETAQKFIAYVEILFRAIDRLANIIRKQGLKPLAYGREAKLLCKKIVAFFTLLSKTQDTGVRKLGVTQELLSLVTGLAHYLKLLIRIGLQGALKSESQTRSTAALDALLTDLAELESANRVSLGSFDQNPGLVADGADRCGRCNDAIDDECFIHHNTDQRFHIIRPEIKEDEGRPRAECVFACSVCSHGLAQDLSKANWSHSKRKLYCSVDAKSAPESQSGFAYVTKLQQYIFLLKVALARLLNVLMSSGNLPHTSEDPNLSTYEANQGQRITASGQPVVPPRLNSRSRSFAGELNDTTSSFEQTVGEMKRLRSTRNERTLSTTFRKARASRILDGPSGMTPGAEGHDAKSKDFQIVEERDVDGKPHPQLTFNSDGITLDDIPRMAAAQQAKEQRPNAYRHAGPNLIGHGDQGYKLVNGHARAPSAGGKDLLAGEPSPLRVKKYFSELTPLEYFVVRNVAVLSMEPLLEGHFTMDELMGLIESRKPSIWAKFGKAFKNDKAYKKKGVFGVPLDTLVEIKGTESTHGVGPGALRIPPLLDDSISAMRQMDMSVEGVFRKNGNIKRLKDMAEAIDSNQTPDLNKENPVQIAALLKRFLREMPDPLLTFKLHRLWVTIQKLGSEDKRQRLLHLACCLLPKPHRDTMEVLFAFLNWTASFSHVDEESGSRMDVHNLATVMAPNLLYTNAKMPGVDDSFLAIESITQLIANNDCFAEVPDDLQGVLTDTSLFDGSADITTKEILKRYGNIGKGTIATAPQGNPQGDSATPAPLSTSNSGRGNTPVVHRVDADTHQSDAWQKQSSVRHVQAPGQPPYAGGPGAMTPPQHSFEFAAPNSPYSRDRSGSQGSQHSLGPAGGRQSYQPTRGPMGPRADTELPVR